MSKSIARVLRDGRLQQPLPFADDIPAPAQGRSGRNRRASDRRSPQPTRIVAFGLSHHTTPVDLRERLAMDEHAVREHLRRLCAEVCQEALIISTCNRFELYAVMPEDATGRARAWLRALANGAGEAIDRHLREYEQAEAVDHLFRVACSLDSLVVGEPQILGQVKEAVRIAEEVGTVGPTLGHLARHALSTAKRVRNETAIGRSRVGIGNAGVELARRIFGELEGRRALLVGIGKMGRQVARALLGSGLSGFLVANRTLANAEALAAELACDALVPLTEVATVLEQVDIVITATSSTAPIIEPAAVRQALRARRNRPLFFIDLSVPRNVDSAVRGIHGAYVFDVDDLAQVVEHGRAARGESCTDALRIVDEERSRFLDDLREREIGAAIARITRWAEEARQAEIVRRRRACEPLTPAQAEAFEAMARAITNKLLDGPIRAIREAARERDEGRLAALLAQWPAPENP